MTDAPTPTTRLRLAALPRAPHPVHWEPEAEARAALADELGLRALRKLRLAGTLHPEGAADWRLEAVLGATAVQDCVVTLAPVTTRLDEPVRLRLVRDAGEAPEGEAEMPEGADEVEPLPETLDLASVGAEALALALPDFPRADGAPAAAAAAAPPGVAPLTDEDVKPFAGLADLKTRLEDGDP